MKSKSKQLKGITNNFILLFLFLVLWQISQAQRSVVALPYMNVVYIGLDNPVKIAVEGYTNDQLTISSKGCSISKTNLNNHIIEAKSQRDTCRVYVTYKYRDSLITETNYFRIREVPKPVSYFGTLDPDWGPFNSEELLNQIAIKGVLPNFHYKDWEFTVINFAILYVPIQGKTFSFSVKGNLIPLEIKRLIAMARSGDKILIDGIDAIGPGGIKRRMGPIAITIKSNLPQLYNTPEYYTFQLSKKSRPEKIDYPFDEHLFYNIEPGILKGFKNCCDDKKLILEVKRNSKKIVYEKQFYSSGKLKTIYNFEENDSIGEAISYYENGKIKSRGHVIVRVIGVLESYRQSFENFAPENNDLVQLTDSFLFHNYAPIGKWTGYYENGKRALECNFRLYCFGLIPTKEGDPAFDLSDENPNKKQASIKEATESKDGYFKPALSGSFQLYDRQGVIISAKNFPD